MSTTIEIAKAGLNRFYDEGYVCWPLGKLTVVFQNKRLEQPEIANELKRWEEAGWIKLPKTDAEYLIMLNIIPD